MPLGIFTQPTYASAKDMSERATLVVHHWRLKAFLCCGLLLVGCAEKEEYTEKPVEELYNSAYDLFDQQSYKNAAKAFVEVERQHPYANWAVKAQLMAAYSYYAANSYGDAIETLQVFLQLHPGHPNVSYAYYLLGLCYFSQIPILQRDQKVTEDALGTFQEVLTRFPDSLYAKDARIKICMLQDHLAGKEMDVGRTYQARNHHIAALRRFQNVVKTYGFTSYAQEALYRVIECSIALQLKDQVQVYLAILGHNAPSSSWYKDAYSLVGQHYPDLCENTPSSKS